MTTVEELAVICEYEIKRGNGKKKILISNDDEGNGFHPLYYGFSNAEITKQYGHDPNHQILLG